MGPANPIKLLPAHSSQAKNAGWSLGWSALFATNALRPHTVRAVAKRNCLAVVLIAFAQRDMPPPLRPPYLTSCSRQDPNSVSVATLGLCAVLEFAPPMTIACRRYTNCFATAGVTRVCEANTADFLLGADSRHQADHTSSSECACFDDGCISDTQL